MLSACSLSTSQANENFLDIIKNFIELADLQGLNLRIFWSAKYMLLTPFHDTYSLFYSILKKTCRCEVGFVDKVNSLTTPERHSILKYWVFMMTCGDSDSSVGNGFDECIYVGTESLTVEVLLEYLVGTVESSLKT